MTKQQWEDKAQNIESEMEDIEDTSYYYEYLCRKRDACYFWAANAIDEEDLDEEEKEIFRD